MRFLLVSMLLLTGIFACETKAPDLSSQAAEEIRRAEAAFAQMAKEKGVPEAFLAYAADDAVMLRNDVLVEGQEGMRAYFSKSTLDSVQLTWQPDKVVAAKSGELGYTYGRYQFSAKDTSGQLIQSEGIFHTVWQKQEDGNWKFVWD